MNCFDCNQTTEKKRFKAYLYKGISLENVHLLNVDILICNKCKLETLILPKPAELHTAIGLAVVLQPARLSGEDVKYLRRNARFSLREWAKRIGLAEATCSKLEHSRPVSVQNDKLIRVNYLNALKQKLGEEFHLAKYLDMALNVNTEKFKDFAIAINAENPQDSVRYLPYNSPLLAEPQTTVLEAKTLPSEEFTTVTLVSSPQKRKRNCASSLGLTLGENKNVRDNVTLAA